MRDRNYKVILVNNIIGNYITDAEGICDRIGACNGEQNQPLLLRYVWDWQYYLQSEGWICSV